MKHLNQILLAACTILCGLSMPAHAQAIDLPAAAKWALHIDADRLHKTSTGEQLLADLTKNESGAPLNALRSVSRLDLGETLKSITLFGINDSGAHAVARIKGALNPDAILTTFRARRGYESLDYKGHAVHRWQEAFPAGRKRVYGVMVDNSTVMISLSGRMIQASMEALALTPQMKPSGTALVIPALPDTSYASGIARAKAFNLDSMGGGAFKSAGDLHLTMAQTGEQATGTLTLDAGSPEKAIQMRTVAQGMRLVATLARQQDPHLADFAQSLTISSRGAQLRVDMSTPATQLLSRWRHFSTQ